MNGVGRGKEVCYEILAVNTFNSTRKRMSVVVKSPSGTIQLLCKGADNVMFDRAAKATWGPKTRNRKMMEDHLHIFAQVIYIRRSDLIQVFLPFFSTLFHIRRD